MRRLALAALAAVAIAVAVPSAALAKGAGVGEISGPGLDRPITFAGDGHSGGTQSIRIAQASGIFPAAFGQTPNAMSSERPRGDLGPRYTISWVLTAPQTEAERIVQDAYPYAKPNPVTYVEPGQRYFGTQETPGGWFVASPLLKDELVAAGLPAHPPAGVDDGVPWAVTTGLAALAAALVLAVARAVAVRRGGPRATAQAASRSAQAIRRAR